MCVIDDKDRNLRVGVGIVLINSKNQVFIGKRRTRSSKKSSFNMRKPWSMPQGGIELGENPVDAAYRELLEETGTNNVELIAETKCWLKYIIPVNMRRKNSVIIGQKQKWFLLKFLGNDDDFNLNFSIIREFDTWRWTEVNNVIKNSIHFKRQLYIDIFKEFCVYMGIDRSSIYDKTYKRCKNSKKYIAHNTVTNNNE